MVHNAESCFLYLQHEKNNGLCGGNSFMCSCFVRSLSAHGRLVRVRVANLLVDGSDDSVDFRAGRPFLSSPRTHYWRCYASSSSTSAYVNLRCPGRNHNQAI